MEDHNRIKPSIFNRTFWDLWIQKMFRNIASVKYQWLLFLYVPVIYGMFDGKWVTLTNGAIQWSAKISPTTGLSFLGGGFITLALGRIVARTKLTENGNGFDTDK